MKKIILFITLVSIIILFTGCISINDKCKFNCMETSCNFSKMDATAVAYSMHNNDSCYNKNVGICFDKCKE